MLFAKYAPMPKTIQELQEKEFDNEVGRPSHPLQSRYLALQMMRVRGIESEAKLVDNLTLSEKSRGYLGFNIPKKECKKTPHNKIFTEYRQIVGIDNTKSILRELVETAKDLGLYDEEYFVMDSKPIDLCVLLRCKHLKTCPWIKEGKKLPEDCLQYRYENAKPGCKRGKNGKIYRYVGYKKHDIFDLKSGLRAWVISSPANTADSTAGKDLLKVAKDIGFKPDYTLGDPAYDAMGIYNQIIDMGSKPIIKMNERNTVAETFDANGIKVNREGVPICKANHEMKLDEIRDDCTVWKCSGEMDNSHVEDGHCLYNSKHDCKVVLPVENDPRRISIPPRSSEKWSNLYRKRKIGEGFFFNYDEFLELDKVNYTSFGDYTTYVMMADITVLTMVIIADKIGIPRFVRNWKIVGHYVMKSLFGEPIDPEKVMLAMEILEYFGVSIEDILEYREKRKKGE